MWINSSWDWWSGLGLPPSFHAALEVRGRKSGRKRSNPAVIATVDDKRYLVSMLGPESEWVKKVEAADGEAFLRQGRRLVPVEQRAHILKEYVTNRHQRPASRPGQRWSAVGGSRGDCRLVSGIQNRPLREDPNDIPPGGWSEGILTAVSLMPQVHERILRANLVEPESRTAHQALQMRSPDQTSRYCSLQDPSTSLGISAAGSRAAHAC